MLAMVKLKNPNLLQVIAKKVNSTQMGGSTFLSTTMRNRSTYL